MNTVVDCTLPEKILLSAYQLEESGQSPFSAEALIVAAWQGYPRTFGLKGYTEQYPDANKVLTAIMGEKGLARRGWLVKMGQKLYALTREGRQVIRRLTQVDDEPAGAPSPVALSGEHERLLQGLMACSAWIKVREGRRGELTFADACRYWNITEHQPASVLDQRLHLVGSSLHAIERLAGQAGTTLSSGKQVLGSEIGQLMELHDYLEDRFERHLMLLRNRAERR